MYDNTMYSYMHENLSTPVEYPRNPKIVFVYTIFRQFLQL